MALRTKASYLPGVENHLDGNPLSGFQPGGHLEEVPDKEIQEEKPKRKLNTLDIYVIFSIISLIVYTIISQLMVVYTGASLDTLTTCFFACFGGEILSACLIKIFKLKKKDDDIGGNVG